MKHYINEVKRMQQLAGILKESDAANIYAEEIIDLISSGAGEATGINTPDFTTLVAKIKGENMIDAVSQALVDYVNSGEGFTQEDIDALTAAGFNMQGAEVEGEDYDEVNTLIDEFLDHYDITLTPEERAKFANAIEMDYEEGDITDATIQDAAEIYDASGIRSIEDDEEEN